MATSSPKTAKNDYSYLYYANVAILEGERSAGHESTCSRWTRGCDTRLVGWGCMGFGARRLMYSFCESRESRERQREVVHGCHVFLLLDVNKLATGVSSFILFQPLGVGTSWRLKAWSLGEVPCTVHFVALSTCSCHYNLEKMQWRFRTLTLLDKELKGLVGSSLRRSGSTRWVIAWMTSRDISTSIIFSHEKGRPSSFFCHFENTALARGTHKHACAQPTTWIWIFAGRFVSTCGAYRCAGGARAPGLTALVLYICIFNGQLPWLSHMDPQERFSTFALAMAWLVGTVRSVCLAKEFLWKILSQKKSEDCCSTRMLHGDLSLFFWVVLSFTFTLGKDYCKRYATWQRKHFLRGFKPQSIFCFTAFTAEVPIPWLFLLVFFLTTSLLRRKTRSFVLFGR